MSRNGRIAIVVLALVAFIVAVIVKESRKHPEDELAGTSAQPTSSLAEAPPPAGSPTSSNPVPTSAAESQSVTRVIPSRDAGGSISEANVETARDPSGIPRLVDLGANKCIPCKMMAPILEELKTEYRGRFSLEVIDIRENRGAGQRYGVRVIPTQIFFDASGRELFRHEGFIDKDAILAKWKELGVDLGVH